MPQHESSVARPRGHDPRRRNRGTRPVTRAPSRRRQPLTVVPSFGPRRSSRDVSTLRAAPLLAAFACIAVAASGLAGIAGAVILALVGALSLAHFVANAQAGSERRILRALNGRTAETNQDARLMNIVEGLCAAFGLSAPAVVVVDSEDLNALTLGRRRRRATLVVTSGALERLDRIELEALVAHELAHLRRGDVERAAVIMSALGFLALRNSGVANRCARLAGIDRESFADLAATSITRYPPALADTLELLDENDGELAGVLPRDVVRLTFWQWCAPLPVPGEQTSTSIGLSLQQRAQVLREL
jgi:Peptidase family M48